MDLADDLSGEMAVNLKASALGYASLGWQIMPLHSATGGRCSCGKAECNSPGKHPRTRRGLKDASTESGVIERWWSQWPTANVGIRTGAVSGIVVIDIDPRHGGDDSLAALIREHGELPPTAEALTGGGGQHLIFQHPGGTIGNRAGLLIGIDVRGDGGYIVAPPSNHVAGGRYRWRDRRGPGEIEPAAVPPPLLELMTAERTEQANRDKLVPANGDSLAKLVQAGQRYVARCASASSGGRNNAAFNVAGHLFSFVTDDGLRLSESHVLNLLRPWNDRNSPALSKRELEQVVSSAMKNGAPRSPHIVRTRAWGQTGRTDQRASVGSVGGPHPDSPDEWPDPQPLPEELPSVAPIKFDLLPSSLRPWIEDIAERIQCPPDYPAVAAMIALAGIVGRKVAIRPKKHDDWLVVPNLWGAAIGPPSVMKTPAIQEPLRPLKRLEIEAKREFDAAMQRFEADAMVAKVRRKAVEGEIKKALKGGGDAHVIASEALNKESDCPVRRRYLVNDSTVEKLGELLNENPNGVVCYRDELIGLLKSLEKEGQEGARAFYLEAWNGMGRYTYDRIGRGTIDIECAIISVIGSIQPGPLGAYLRGALANGKDADGLMQRFQLAVWPDISRKWHNVDRWPDSAARQRAFEAYVRLDSLKPPDVGAEPDRRDPDGIAFLRFGPEAQALFDEWRSELERRLRRDDEHPAMVSHLAKYRSLIPSLALLIHLADDGTGPVRLEAIQKAVRWGRYLESHARRIYAPALAPDVAAARALGRKLLDGTLTDGFAVRDVYRNGWVGLSRREEAATAIDLLVDFDWLMTTTEPTAGRSRTRHWINPRIHGISPEGPDKTDKSPSGDLLSVMSVADQGSQNIDAARTSGKGPGVSLGDRQNGQGCLDGEQPPDDVRYARVREEQAGNVDDWGDL